MGFRLTEQRAALRHKAERLEKHGDNEVLAADLEFELETANTALAMFHPDLRAALYATTDGQAQAELVEDKEHMPLLRFPSMSAGIKWETPPMKEAELRIHQGRKDLVFVETTVGKYRIECKEGGTVVIRFRCQVYPSGPQSGALSELLQAGECTVSVTPKAVEEAPAGDAGKPS